MPCLDGHVPLYHDARYARRHDRTCRHTAAMDVYASGSARSSVEARTADAGGVPFRAREHLPFGAYCL